MFGQKFIRCLSDQVAQIADRLSLVEKIALKCNYRNTSIGVFNLKVLTGYACFTKCPTTLQWFYYVLLFNESSGWLQGFELISADTIFVQATAIPSLLLNIVCDVCERATFRTVIKFKRLLLKINTRICFFNHKLSSVSCK